MIIGATSGWRLPLLIVAVPAVASLIGAVIAGRAARDAKRAEVESARLRQLEERLASKKYEIYKPVIEMLRDMLYSPNAGVQPPDTTTVVKKLSDFTTWITIYGSDDALVGFRNFMQAAFHDPPAQLSIRLYADFVLAARRDMGYENTRISALEVLGLRINDLHDDLASYRVATLPFDDLCAEYGWVPPWRRLPQPSDDAGQDPTEPEPEPDTE